MLLFRKERIYFGDYKPENFLVTFHGRKVKLGDFGCSFLMQNTNYLKGLTFAWALPEVHQKVINGEVVSEDLLVKNDIFALFASFAELLETYENIDRIGIGDIFTNC